MQLNKFTDYALRILMYIARPRENAYTIAEIAENLQVSQNHLVKIVHFMGKQKWIITTRGKGGGIHLHPQAKKIRLGEIVTILQGDSEIVDCIPCILRPHCGLKSILDHALDRFYESLDQYTLEEVLENNIIPSTQQSNIDFLHVSQKH